MYNMFYNCKKFNHCLDEWKLNSLKECDNIMEGCDKYIFNKIQLQNTT